MDKNATYTVFPSDSIPRVTEVVGQSFVGADDAVHYMNKYLADGWILVGSWSSLYGDPRENNYQFHVVMGWAG